MARPLLEPVFRVDLPHGRAVAVAIPPVMTTALLEALDLEEQRFMSGLPPLRQLSFAAGRAALRMALAELGIPLRPLLPDGRGAPVLPPEAVGSISHKRTLAVGLAAPREWLRSQLGPAPVGNDGAGDVDIDIGVDLEDDQPPKVDISRRVLTPEELADIADLAPGEVPGTSSGAPAHGPLLDRFTLKEAFYKAVNGFVGRSVWFHDVRVTGIDGRGRASFGGPLFERHALECSGWVGRPAPHFVLASALVRASKGG